MQRRSCALVALGIVCLAAGRTHAGEDEPLVLADWVRSTFADLARGPANQAIDRGLDSARLAARVAASESPISIEASLTQGLYQPNPDDQEVALYGQTRATSDLNSLVSIRTRRGWEADFGANAGFHALDPSAHLYPHQLYAQLGYDLGRGGPAGQAEILERINVANARHDVYQLAQARIDLRVRYLRMAADLFVTECQLRRLGMVESEVAQVIETAKLRLDTKTIAYKDFLNLVDLANNFRRRTASLESQRRTLLAELAAFGTDVARATRRLGDRQLACPDRVADLLEELEDELPDAESRRNAALHLPAVTAAGFTAATAQLSVALERADQRPRIAPFLRAQLARATPSNEEIGAVLFGVDVRWTLPGERGRMALEAQHSQAVEAGARRRELLIGNMAHIDALIAAIRAQKPVFQAIEASLKNSRELIRTLDDERRVGLTDSLSFSSGVLNTIDAYLDLLNAWGIVEKSRLELSLQLAGADADDVR